MPENVRSMDGLARRVRSKMMPIFDTEAFMRKLHQAATTRGKTMKDVAAETGVSETTLSRMSNGFRVCDAASLAALSAWAGINPARYSGWAPPRPTRSGSIDGTKLRAND